MLIAERYRLGASLGRGGMGEVFRATDEALGREVAVKVMLRSQDTDSAAERFQREARAAARLSDPHIVAVYDFGQSDDNFYLVMELVEGRSVAAEVDEHGPLPWDRAVDIVEQAAAGLAVAHAQNVVHRDIKPSNLLIAADGTVKVADFGIAHLPGSETTDLTVAGQIMGSPHYLSPERARGLRGGPESDVYALGCVLYQLVTGRPPFMGDHPTAVLYQHVDTAPVPPSRLRPDLAGPFEPVLLRMLAKAPGERPTAAQLTALPAAADWFPTAALPSERPTEPVAGPPVAGPPVAGLPVAGSSVAGPTDDLRARKPLLVAAVALLALAGAVTAGVVLRNTGDNLPPTGEVGQQPSTSVGTPGTSEPTPTSETSEPTSGGTSASTTETAPSNTASTTPTPTPTPTAPTSTTPSTTPSSTPTPTPTPTTSPSSATSSPTSTPTSSPTSSSPTTSSTPEPSETPAPSGSPAPSTTPRP